MFKFFLIFASLLVWSVPLSAQGNDQLDIQDREMELVAAVEKGALKTLKSLVKAGADPQKLVLTHDSFYMFSIGREVYLEGLAQKVEPFPVSISSIHANAFQADEQVLASLLKLGVDVDARDSRGKTPLMYALHQPRGEAYALRLLQEGANYTARDQVGNSTMHYAALGGNLVGIHLMAAGGIDINSRNRDGMTPLHVAVIRSPRNVVEGMLELGADLHARDHLGMTVLHYAAGFGDRDFVKFLYKKAPDLFVEDQSGMNPLDLAYQAGNQEVAIFFRRQGHHFGGFQYEELVQAVQDKDAQEVRSLLRAGANPNRPAAVYPLHLAAQLGDTLSLVYLVRYGARMDVLDSAFRSPLKVAFESGQAAAANTLMRLGGQPDSRWLPPLVFNFRDPVWAREWMETLVLMLEKVANPNLAGGPMQLPSLHQAAYFGLEEVVQQLIDVQVNVNLVDSEGWTPLHWAIIKRDLTAEVPEKVGIARRLLEAGANPHLVTRQAKRLPHQQPYLSKRIPSNASALDVFEYALPVDSKMLFLLDSHGLKSNLVAADFFENGVALLQVNEFDAALAEFNKALEREKRYSEAYFYRGVTKREMEMEQGALLDFQLALDYRPVYSAAYLEMGKVYFNLKDYKAAIRSLDKAIIQGSRSSETYFLRGSSKINLGFVEEGCADMVQASARGSEPAATALKLRCNTK